MKRVSPVGQGGRANRGVLSPSSTRDPFRSALVGLVALKAAGLILVFDHGGLVAFDLPKSLFSRGVEWLTGGVLVILFLRYGLAVLPATRLHYLVFAFLVMNAVAALLSPNTYVAVYGERGRYLGLTFLADMAVLYVATAVGFRGLRDWAVLAGAVAIATLASMGYGLIQLLAKDPFLWSDDPTTRPFSTLGNPDMFGHLLSAGVAAGLAVAALGPTGRIGMLTRAAAATLAAAMLLLSAFVATRAFLLGIFAALATLAVVYVRWRGLDRSTIARLAVTGAVLLVALTGVLLATPLGERARATLQQVANRDRLLIYESAVRAIGDRPLIGYGPNGFAVVYPKYRQPESILLAGPDVGQSDTHSWVLETAASVGLPGVAIFLGILGVACGILLRRMHEAPLLAGTSIVVLASYLGHGLVSVGTIGVAWVPWMALGAAASLTPTIEIAPRSVHLFGRSLILAVAVAGALSGMRAWQANQDVRDAAVAWRAGRYEAAATRAASAVARDDGRADHWNWLGLARDGRNEVRAAGDAFEQAAARAPHRAVYWENLALVRVRQAAAGDLSSGGADAALNAAKRAVEVDPNRPAANGTLGEVAEAVGEHELALRSIVYSMRLFPGAGIYDRVAVSAALAMSDSALARSLLEQAIRDRDVASLRVAAAQLAIRLNETDAARVHAMRALELEPGNADARAILAQLN